MSNSSNPISPHGGYLSLRSYQGSEIIYDLTIKFCELYIDKTNMSNKSYKSYSRLSDQMIQAARSGKQNIAEGSQASGTSKKTELKLVSVARASLEELLLDYDDYLRQHNLSLWPKTHPSSQKIRSLVYLPNKSYTTYMPYLSAGESACNCLISLIHQTNYLLDQQLRSLEKEFLTKGGFTERLYQSRKNFQSRQL